MSLGGTSRGGAPIDATGGIEATGRPKGYQIGAGNSPQLERGISRTVDDVIQLLSSVAADLGGREEAASALAVELNRYDPPLGFGHWLGNEVSSVEKHALASLLPSEANNALDYISDRQWTDIRMEATRVMRRLPEDSPADAIVLYTFSNGVAALGDVVKEESPDPDPTLRDLLARLDGVAAEVAAAKQNGQPPSWQKLKVVLWLLGQALIIAAVAGGSLSSDRAAPAIANGIAILVAVQTLTRGSQK